MAEPTTIARPYAAAAFDFAHKAGRLAEWSEMLHFAAEVVAQPTFAARLDDPRLGRNNLARLLFEVGGERFDAHSRNFLRTMADNDRLAQVPMVANLFDRLRDEVEQKADVEVVSAYAVNATQKRKLVEALEKRLGKAVNLTTTIDKSLIGGLVIRVGDEVIDASLQSGLNQLATALHPS